MVTFSIDHLSDYVIITGNPPCQTGSGSKQTHVVYSEPVGISFISPPNVYMTNTWLVPGSTGGYTARWCQRAV